MVYWATGGDERMPRITTMSVHPERVEALKEYRDQHDLRSLDAALDDLLNQERD
jgi:hypothetical protein